MKPKYVIANIKMLIELNDEEGIKPLEDYVKVDIVPCDQDITTFEKTSENASIIEQVYNIIKEKETELEPFFIKEKELKQHKKKLNNNTKKNIHSQLRKTFKNY